MNAHIASSRKLMAFVMAVWELLYESLITPVPTQQVSTAISWRFFDITAAHSYAAPPAPQRCRRRGMNSSVNNTNTNGTNCVIDISA